MTVARAAHVHQIELELPILSLTSNNVGTSVLTSDFVNKVTATITTLNATKI